MNYKFCMTLALAAALFSTGCATKTTYVDNDSSRLIANVDEINIQDFARAADEMVQSIIEDCISTGDLEGVDGKKPILAISRIVNNTSMQFDTDLLIKRIRTALLKTKKVQTTTTLNLARSEDPLAEMADAEEEIITEERMKHSYSLSGKIIEVTTRTRNLRQSSYEFQLTISNRRGLVVWEDIKTITKQGKKASVGF
ncbi:MAG: penicillin-binding protein activator LpoB [Verrucomicrobia bacterium]|nr:penicillin-binding protein activator LpoB [Verrucomicrobiota bacterium]MBR5738350.1 penicillin-binding protein activator LpoB [Verrucomicrobiota bacterium]MBR5978703.1 penicillin-binding protein activator LpoB [Verrucomicrobiota bacterium]MBR6461138.1 penicillin-binding protein activator LpoB [Verrucomicrobiota bacterium]MBR6464623.1 penicillin-binding protein activator LpoB [Verrucomicrobiota bacterium]